ncbi:MAG: hypothetical protein MJY46_04215 [Bacteroidales bacterium]|nr:hypothetical protein [Bacteroidales bacterium]
MKNFYEKEAGCEAEFMQLGSIYHLWTQEDFEIIFTCDDEFKTGMNIIGLCAMMHPDIKIITFELMSNHMHFAISGNETDVVTFFSMTKKYLSRYFTKAGRRIGWNKFTERHRLLKSLNEARNVIIYINRNGYLVNERYTPFSYPWGANRYFYNQDIKDLAAQNSMDMTFRLRRKSICSHKADNISDMQTYGGYALPLSFCGIEDGECLFSSASNYFYRLGKNIENMKEIAREIGESVFYTDDEIYSVLLKICKKKYNCTHPWELSSSAKIELAKLLRYEYNSNSKQIVRMLKIPSQVLTSIGIRE